MQSLSGLKSLRSSDFSLLRHALEKKRAKTRPIPSTARLELQTDTNTLADSETEKKGIIAPLSCCDAGRFWRAGVEVETLLQTVSLPCSKEKAEKCRQLWDALEKVQLYEAQSAAAKQGAATMLRHLGEVRLGQVNAPVSDPGIGDIVFGDGEGKCEKS